MGENEWIEKWKGSANEHRCHISLILGLHGTFTCPGLLDPVAALLLQHQQRLLVEASLEERALPINSGVHTMAIHTEER